MNRVIEAYRDANARAGRDLELGENLSIGFHFYIADTQERGDGGRRKSSTRRI